MNRALRLIRPAAALALCAALAACASVARVDAGGDIHAFLTAVRDGDKPGFDRHVDRPALRAQLRARLIAETAAARGPDSPEAALTVIAGPLVDIAVEALVQPSVFRAAAAMAGYSTETAIPNAVVIARQLKTLPGGRVCVLVDERCTFVFRNDGDSWRLIAFEGDLAAIKSRIARRR